MSAALFKKHDTAIETPSSKKEIPAGLWLKCKGCEEVLYRAKLEENLQVCPHCSHHYPMTAHERITLLTDKISADSQHFFKKMGFEYSSMIPMRRIIT